MTDDEERRASPRRQQDAYNDAMAQNIAALAAVVEATAVNVQNLSAEVGKLRKAIVPRAEIAAEASRITVQRRRQGAFVALFAIVLAWVSDEHIERCSPGARAELAIEVFLNTDYTPIPPEGLPDQERVAASKRLQDDIKKALEGRDQPKVCDVTFPLHDHDGNGWPHLYNGLGLALWGAMGIGGYLWVREPRRRHEPK